MFREEKNLKDPEGKSVTSYEENSPNNVSFSLSYTKINKLITALYMVTDIIDRDEPLRNKLRTLGIEILSDTNLSPLKVSEKIKETVSFLDIASAVNIISSMNSNILKKEFLELDMAIKEALGSNKIINKRVNLSEFFVEELVNPTGGQKDFKSKSIGHSSFANVGIQKGGTLMKALRKIDMSNKKSTATNAESFNILKKQRRGEITNFIQKNGGNATITDIKNGAIGSLASCGEKTLQRELVSMVKDGVLKKTGEKRWSRYSLSGKTF